MYPRPFPQSAALSRRARKVVADGVSRTTIALHPHPVYAYRGRGSRVYDVDGNEWIDFNNNYTALIHGHAHPEICAAVERQLRSGVSFSFATEAEIELAEILCGRVASLDRIRFTNSGTEAVMLAIKAARAHTGRAKIAKCEGAYHGAYDYAETSLDSGPRNWGDAVPQPVPYCDGTPGGVLADVVILPWNDTDTALAILQANRRQLAGVLFDPISNRVGMIPPDPDFVAMLRSFTHENGSVLIFDEVLAFRCGLGGMQGVLGIEPDLTTLGKIIGGGFPVGAVAGRESFMAVFESRDGKAPLSHSGTFNANPITMVAGARAMELVTPRALKRLNTLGAEARQGIQRAIEASGVAAQVTGQGSLFRIHLHQRELRSYRDAHLDAEEQARLERFHQHLASAGICITPQGLGCLSTATQPADLEALSHAVEEALRATELVAVASR